MSRQIVSKISTMKPLFNLAVRRLTLMAFVLMLTNPCFAQEPGSETAHSDGRVQVNPQRTFYGEDRGRVTEYTANAIKAALENLLSFMQQGEVQSDVWVDPLLAQLVFSHLREAETLVTGVVNDAFQTDSNQLYYLTSHALSVARQSYLDNVSEEVDRQLLNQRLVVRVRRGGSDTTPLEQDRSSAVRLQMDLSAPLEQNFARSTRSFDRPTNIARRVYATRVSPPIAEGDTRALFETANAPQDSYIVEFLLMPNPPGESGRFAMLNEVLDDGSMTLESPVTITRGNTDREHAVITMSLRTRLAIALLRGGPSLLSQVSLDPRNIRLVYRTIGIDELPSPPPLPFIHFLGIRPATDNLSLLGHRDIESGVVLDPSSRLLQYLLVGWQPLLSTPTAEEREELLSNLAKDYDGRTYLRDVYVMLHTSAAGVDALLWPEDMKDAFRNLFDTDGEGISARALANEVAAAVYQHEGHGAVRGVLYSNGHDLLRQEVIAQHGFSLVTSQPHRRVSPDQFLTIARYDRDTNADSRVLVERHLAAQAMTAQQSLVTDAVFTPTLDWDMHTAAQALLGNLQNFRTYNLDRFTVGDFVRRGVLRVYLPVPEEQSVTSAQERDTWTATVFPRVAATIDPRQFGVILTCDIPVSLLESSVLQEPLTELGEVALDIVDIGHYAVYRHRTAAFESLYALALSAYTRDSQNQLAYHRLNRSAEEVTAAFSHNQGDGIGSDITQEEIRSARLIGRYLRDLFTLLADYRTIYPVLSESRDRLAGNNTRQQSDSLHVFEDAFLRERVPIILALIQSVVMHPNNRALFEFVLAEAQIPVGSIAHFLELGGYVVNSSIAFTSFELAIPLGDARELEVSFLSDASAEDELTKNVQRFVEAGTAVLRARNQLSPSSASHESYPRVTQLAFAIASQFPKLEERDVERLTPARFDFPDQAVAHLAGRAPSSLTAGNRTAESLVMLLAPTTTFPLSWQGTLTSRNTGSVRGPNARPSADASTERAVTHRFVVSGAIEDALSSGSTPVVGGALLALRNAMATRGEGRDQAQALYLSLEHRGVLRDLEARIPSLGEAVTELRASFGDIPKAQFTEAHAEALAALRLQMMQDLRQAEAQQREEQAENLRRQIDTLNEAIVDAAQPLARDSRQNPAMGGKRVAEIVASQSSEQALSRDGALALLRARSLRPNEIDRRVSVDFVATEAALTVVYARSQNAGLVEIIERQRALRPRR